MLPAPDIVTVHCLSLEAQEGPVGADQGAINIVYYTRQPATTKNYLAKKVSSAEVEKPCFRVLRDCHQE